MPLAAVVILSRRAFLARLIRKTLTKAVRVTMTRHGEQFRYRQPMNFRRKRTNPFADSALNHRQRVVFVVFKYLARSPLLFLIFCAREITNMPQGLSHNFPLTCGLLNC